MTEPVYRPPCGKHRSETRRNPVKHGGSRMKSPGQPSRAKCATCSPASKLTVRRVPRKHALGSCRRCLRQRWPVWGSSMQPTKRSRPRNARWCCLFRAPRPTRAACARHLRQRTSRPNLMAAAMRPEAWMPPSAARVWWPRRRAARWLPRVRSVIAPGRPVREAGPTPAPNGAAVQAAVAGGDSAFDQLTNGTQHERVEHGCGHKDSGDHAGGDGCGGIRRRLRRRK